MSSIGDYKKTNKPIDVQENKHAGSDVLKPLDLIAPQ